MTIIKLAVCAFLILIPLSASYAEQKEHQIDISLNQCLEKDVSTANQLECLSNAYKMWDKELNSGYKQLMNKLDTTGQKSLKDAQNAWIKYRDTEMKLKDNIIGTMEGSIWSIVYADDRNSLVKERTLALKRYVELIDENKGGN